MYPWKNGTLSLYKLNFKCLKFSTSRDDNFPVYSLVSARKPTTICLYSMRFTFPTFQLLPFSPFGKGEANAQLKAKVQVLHEKFTFSFGRGGQMSNSNPKSKLLMRSFLFLYLAGRGVDK